MMSLRMDFLCHAISFEDTSGGGCFCELDTRDGLHVTLGVL